MKLSAPFRNDTNQRYSKQLFWEQWVQLPIDARIIEPAFSLHQEKDGLVCLGKEYINDADPSGYTTSTRLLGEFGYWKHLLKAGWFREALGLWNEELEAKLYAEGLAKIRELANSEDKGALTAAKYLANREFVRATTGPKRGRPSNEEVEGRLVEEAKERSAFEDDIKRLKLVGNNGN